MQKNNCMMEILRSKDEKPIESLEELSKSEFSYKKRVNAEKILQESFYKKDVLRVIVEQLEKVRKNDRAVNYEWGKYFLVWIILIIKKECSFYIEMNKLNEFLETNDKIVQTKYISKLATHLDKTFKQLFPDLNQDIEHIIKCKPGRKVEGFRLTDDLQSKILASLVEKSAQILSSQVTESSTSKSPEENFSLSIVDIQNRALWYSKNNIDKLKGTLYTPEVYTPREVERLIDDFFRVDNDKAGFFLVGASGMGKTNLIAHLAEVRIENSRKDVVIFLPLKLIPISNEGIEKTICNSIGWNMSFAELLNKFDAATKKDAQYSSSMFVIFIDGIDDTSERAREIYKQTWQIVDNSFNFKFSWLRVIYSCRDSFYYLNKQMSNITPPSLITHYTEINDYVESSEIVLESFSDAELKGAFENYSKIRGFQLETGFNELSPELKRMMRDPFILRLIMEAYNGKKIPSKPLLGEVFKKYCEKKIPMNSSMRDFIKRFVQLLWDNKNTKLPLSNLRKREDQGKDSKNIDPDYIYHLLLDEKIIYSSKETPAYSDREPVEFVAFRHERLFEYLLSIEIEELYGNQAESLISLSKQAHNYHALSGALLYVINHLFHDNNYSSIGDFFARGSENISYNIVRDLLYINGQSFNDNDEDRFGSLILAIFKSNTFRVRQFLYELSDYFQTSGYDVLALCSYKKYMHYFEKARSEKSVTLGDFLIFSDCRNNLGKFWESRGEPKKAEYCYRECLKILDCFHKNITDLSETIKMEVELGIARVYNNLGAYYDSRDDVRNAKNFYEKSLKKYELLRKTHPDNIESTIGVAKLNQQIGSLPQKLKWKDDEFSERCYKTSIEIYETLYEKNPFDIEIGIGIARGYAHLGALYSFASDCSSELAETNYLKSLDHFELLHKNDPDNIDIALELALVYDNMVILYDSCSQQAKAEKCSISSLNIYEALYRRNPNNDKIVDGLANAYNTRGALSQALGDTENAEFYYTKSFEMEKLAYEKDPDNFELGHGIAVAYMSIGSLYRAQGRLKQAQDYYERSIQINKILLNRNKDNIEAAETLAESYMILGYLHYNMGRISEANVYYKESENVIAPFQKKKPKDIEKMTAELYHYTVWHNNSFNDMKWAEEKLATSLKYFERVHKSDSESIYVTYKLAATYANLGFLFYLQSKFEQACEYYDKSFVIYEQLDDKADYCIDIIDGMARLQNFKGILEMIGIINAHGNIERDNQTEKGLEIDIEIDTKSPHCFENARYSFEKGLQLYDSLCQKRNIEYSNVIDGLAMTYNNLGMLYHLMGNKNMAESHYIMAQKKYEAFIEKTSDSIFIKNNLSKVYNNLGSYYHMLGNDKESERYYKKCDELVVDVNQLSPIFNL